MPDSPHHQLSIALGADHGGFALKETLLAHLSGKGYTVKDCGTFSSRPVDYPEFARIVAEKVSTGEVDFGIVVDGAGIGSAMTANKIDGVRAAQCYDLSTARNAREHNNANVLTLGAGLTGTALAKQIAEIFLTTACTEERHLRRVQMINDLDRSGREHFRDRTEKQPEKEEDVQSITQDDMTRIAERVSELLTSTGILPGDITGAACDSEMVCSCGVHLEKDPATLRHFMQMGVNRFGYHDGTGGDCVPEDIARCIDHTFLKPTATTADIKRICQEAREFQFASVCVSPSYVRLAARELAGTAVNVCTVVGFPSGAHAPEIKALEARQAIREGAKEIDMVINIGALKSGDDDLVYRDIRGVSEACSDGSAISKVIIETAYLTDEEKVRACKLAVRARANYVKTSTGFGPHGATVEDVELMSKIVQPMGLGVKAAGGISSYDDARKMIAAGATRLGASAGIRIMSESRSITFSN
ncbi:MAG: deoxyribose-phosphate aldolase [FCB group bacterium]|nr:deoxyribose-phosphate aldolase [FCB group bacterium]